MTAAAATATDPGHKRLVCDIQAELKCPARDTLLTNALAYHYHCLLSPLVAPKQRLLDDLVAMDYMQLARKAIAGDYENYADAPTATETYYLLKRGMKAILARHRGNTSSAATASSK